MRGESDDLQISSNKRGVDSSVMDVCEVHQLTRGVKRTSAILVDEKPRQHEKKRTMLNVICFKVSFLQLSQMHFFSAGEHLHASVCLLAQPSFRRGPWLRTIIMAKSKLLRGFSSDKDGKFCVFNSLAINKEQVGDDSEKRSHADEP